MSAPKLAVLGHPNKGKSSIVATLAQDDSVAIGPDPGTTMRCRTFPLTVDGELLYELIDTPGFQRARGALAWMKEHETTVAEHPEVVAAFVRDPANIERFPDECELLTPLIEGAGVLYVVDGSVPYGVEYEAEMEILRWAGGPRMALINPIGGAGFVDEWRRALSQYFNVVRVFDAVSADFEKRIELLKGFAELQEDWRKPLERAVSALRNDRTRRISEAARGVSEGILDMLTHSEERRLGPSDEAEEYREGLEARFLDRLRAREAEMRRLVEAAYAQHSVEREESILDAFERESLFSEQSWRLFGLRRREIMVLGALGGGLAGSMLDAAVGGASLLAGTLVGGGLGAVTALLGAEQVANTTILSMPLGTRSLQVGPTKNLQLPHVVFNRARLHHSLVANRTHAERKALQLDDSAAKLLPPLEEKDRRRIESAFRRIRSGDPIEGGEELFEAVLMVFRKDALQAE